MIYNYYLFYLGVIEEKNALIFNLKRLISGKKISTLFGTLKY